VTIPLRTTLTLPPPSSNVRNSLDNLKRELDSFIASRDLQPGTMPVKTAFVTSGRYDLARAVERWGGIPAVAAAIGYDTASGSSGGSESSLSSADTILSSGEFDEMMTVDDVGFDPQREELLMLDDEADPALSAAALRAEIDSW